MSALVELDVAVRRLVESRAAQGLPLTVEDPVALRKVATLTQAETETAVVGEARG